MFGQRNVNLHVKPQTCTLLSVILTRDTNETKFATYVATTV